MYSQLVLYYNIELYILILGNKLKVIPVAFLGNTDFYIYFLCLFL
jgi:hypothetical protein